MPPMIGAELRLTQDSGTGLVQVCLPLNLKLNDFVPMSHAPCHATAKRQQSDVARSCGESYNINRPGTLLCTHLYSPSVYVCAMTPRLRCWKAKGSSSFENFYPKPQGTSWQPP